MNRKLIYSAITNQYDHIRPVKRVPGFDFWLYTDQEDLKVEGWEIKPVQKSEHPILLQREIKLNSHLYTGDYDLSIYMDGNMEIVQDPQMFLEKFYNGGFMSCTHPKRHSLAEEAVEVLRKRKDSPENVEKALGFAKSVGYQDDLGLFENMVLIRDKSEEVKQLEEKWFEIYSQNSVRDQLSLPVASFMTGVEVHTVPREELFKYIKRHRGHNVSVKFKVGDFQPEVNKNWWKGIGGFLRRRS